MNDDELITAVREPFTAVHSTTPVEQIVSRSRAIRARRRMPGVAAALAVAAGTALAVTELLPSGHQTAAQPAAWTVAKQADGNIRVTIHELRDPAALQRTLRADGVPASVTFTGQPNPACQPYPGKGSQSQRRHLPSSVYTSRPGRDNVRILVIHPSALPSGAGLLIGAGHRHQPPRGGSVELTLSLVKAGPQCTGS
jgi:hypothetical protein